MKLWLSPYELENFSFGEKRKGFLIRLQTDQFEAGYADLFPWSEFGDPEADKILDLIKAKKSFPLLERSLAMAHVDGEARQKKVSLLDNLKLKNHFLITQLEGFLEDDLLAAMDDGFTRFKVKVCRNERLERQKFNLWMSQLGDEHLLRLDCNMMATASYLGTIEPFKEKIEFIEDPAAKHFWPVGWPWAYDHPGFDYNRVKTQWQIIKPAKQSNDEIHAPNVVFTSYMDHPVGQAHAFYQATLFGEQVHDYGLMSQHIYKDTEFNKYIQAKGPWMSFREGLGIGFDELWGKQNWIEVF